MSDVIVAMPNVNIQPLWYSLIHLGDIKDGSLFPHFLSFTHKLICLYFYVFIHICIAQS